MRHCVHRHAAAWTVRNTSAAGRGFDYPADDARRWCAMGYRKAFWRIPFAPANRTSVWAAASVATETRGESLSGQSTALFSIGIRNGIGLQLQAEVEFDIAFSQRRDHGIAQIVVGRTERQPRDWRSLIRLRPHRILHRLAFAQQVRHAAKVRSFERAALRLDEQRLHDHVQDVGPLEVEEMKNLRVLQAPLLQVRIRLRIRRHKGGRGDAEHVQREFLLLHQLRPRHTHQFDADAHEADVVDVRRDVRTRSGKAHPDNGTSAVWHRCRDETPAEDCRGR